MPRKPTPQLCWKNRAIRLKASEIPIPPPPGAPRADNVFVRAILQDVGFRGTSAVRNPSTRGLPGFYASGPDSHAPGPPDLGNSER
jgi:hypothetical protein